MFEELIQWAASPEVGWLEPVQPPECLTLLGLSDTTRPVPTRPAIIRPSQCQNPKKTQAISVRPAIAQAPPRRPLGYLT